jgi:uncharacterized RDD family membrane protein YckC
MNPPGGPPPNGDTAAMRAQGRPIPPVQSPTTPHAHPPVVHKFGDVFTYLLARFIAFGIDALLIPFVIATFAFNQFDAGNLAFARTAQASMPLIVAIAFGGALLFSWICEGLFGSTLGKLLFALAVGRVHGGRAGFGRALVRRVFSVIDILLIGPILALVTPNHQRLGDMVTGTVVARARIGFLAPVIAIAAFVAIAYAQITFGGGLNSAIAVSAATTNAAPALGFVFSGIAGLAQKAGLPTSVAPAAPVPSSAPTDEPSAAPPTEPPTQAPPSAPASAVPTEAPSAAASDAPSPAASGDDQTPAPAATPEPPA